MKHIKQLLLLAGLTAATSVAIAQQVAYTSQSVNLRAGPSRDYPVVAVLQAGVSFTVEGCVSDYRWCDVSVGPNRGWLYAGNIRYPYQGSNVPVLTYGATIGIGILAFSIGNYWDDHYRATPWYPQRQRWLDRPQPVYRPVPMRPPPYQRPYIDQRPPQFQRPAPPINVRPPEATRPPPASRPPADRGPARGQERGQDRGQERGQERGQVRGPDRGGDTGRGKGPEGDRGSGVPLGR